MTFHVDTLGDAWEQLKRTADWIQDADTPEHCCLKGINMVGPLRELVDLFEEMEGDARAAAVNKLLRAICDDRYYEETTRDYAEEDRAAVEAQRLHDAISAERRGLHEAFDGRTSP